MNESVRPGGEQKSLERQIRAYHWIRLLAELPGRVAGSESEREAARRTESWLRELGLDEVEQRRVAGGVPPGWSLALHTGVAALGCVFGGVLGLAAVAFAAFGLRQERADGRSPLLRGWRSAPSVNVVARVGAKRPRRRVVLTSTLDAPQTGWIFAQHLRGWPLDSLVSTAMSAAIAIALADALGAQGALFGVLRFALVGGLVAAALVGIEWARAAASPGANDNASGVAAMLSAVEQLAAQLPPDTELWCAAAGAGELGQRGLHALLDEHPEWLDADTALLHFECVGGGRLHYLRSEGTLAKTVYPPMLSELARRVAAGETFGSVPAADLAADSGGRVAARRGAQVLSLIALDEAGLPLLRRRAGDTPDRIDTETVIRAADFGGCVVSAHWRGDAEPLAYV